MRREEAAATKHLELASVERARARSSEELAALGEYTCALERESAAWERAAAEADREAARRRKDASQRASLAADKHELHVRSDPQLAPFLPASPKAPLRSRGLKSSLDAQARWGGPRAAAVTAAEHERWAIREKLRVRAERQFVQLEAAAAESARTANAAEERRRRAESEAALARSEALALRRRYSAALDDKLHSCEVWGGGHAEFAPESFESDGCDGTADEDEQLLQQKQLARVQSSEPPSTDEVRALREALISSGFAPWNPARRRRQQQHAHEANATRAVHVSPLPQDCRHPSPRVSVAEHNTASSRASSRTSPPRNQTRVRQRAGTPPPRLRKPSQLLQAADRTSLHSVLPGWPSHHAMTAVHWAMDDPSEASYRRLVSELQAGGRYPRLTPTGDAEADSYVAWTPPDDTEMGSTLGSTLPWPTEREEPPLALPSSVDEEGEAEMSQRLSLAEQRVAEAMGELARVRASAASRRSHGRSHQMFMH